MRIFSYGIYLHAFLFAVSVNSLFAQGPAVFSFTGGVQTFTVPCGVTSIHVKAWGGGGSGGGTDSYVGAAGGGGGFVQSDIAVTPGQVLSVIVGGGAGPGGNCASSAPGGTGGWGNGIIDGGRGGIAGSHGCSGGGGGGGAGSGIYNGAASLLVAGGGGGGSGGGNNSAGGAGGGGGQNGNTGSGCGIGIAGGNGSGLGTQGGDRGFSFDGAGGGGGGGGDNGGTGGGAPPGCDCGGCGGGGGNSWSSGTNNIITNGSGQTPGNSADADLPAGDAIGGYNSAGGNGFIIITYVSKGILAAFGNTNVCLGAATNFSDSSTVCSGVLNSWNWAFGDGNTSALQNPIHTYSATGVYTSTLIVSGTNGAIDTVTHAVNVYALPVSTFSATTVCKGNATQFTDLSTGGAVSWSWNFGDGNTSTIQNPVNTYLASGTYGVSLTVATGNSCQKTIVIPVVVHPLPVANFSASSICVNAPPTTFTDHSTGASQWNWNFGDGNTSTAQNPVHTYSASGNYNATLVATTNFGCTDTLVQSVTVNPAPVAAYSATTVCFNNATIFTDQSTGGTSWSWNFGDGNTSTQQNPSYTYNHDGNFNAMLVVSNSFGCKDSISTTVRVNPLPTVNFTSKPVCLGSNSCFTDSSTISSGNISAWSWNFSDPASGASNVSTVQNPCHVFSTTGNFNVLLTATSNNGCQNMATQTYTVYSFPVASFSASNVCLNDQTIFVSTSTGAAQWDWNFNDGNTSTLQNPSHVYQNYGTFLPTLIATSAGGCKDTISDTVKVYPHPMVNFTSDKVCKGDTTKFNDLSSIPSGNNVGWNWNFGDGSTSSLQNPGHAYSSDGTYSVTLTVTSNQGCTSSTALSSLVYPLPHADFFSTPGQVVSLTDDVAFTDLSSGGVVQWHWHFGNGDSSVSHNPFYIFSDTGTYIVTQIVMSNFGCIDSTKHFIDVKLYSFYIPSAFSPNGDGLNDFFFGEGVGIIQYEMWIFDRWGSLIFSCQTNGLPQSQICKWDGRVKGGGSDAIQQDTYVWKVRLVNVFYKEYSFTGTVSTVK